MRALNLNATKYDIHAHAYGVETEDGFANVDLRIADDAPVTTGCLTASDCEKIAKWFLDLAKEIKGKK